MSSSLKPPRPEPLNVAPNDDLEDKENLRTLSRSPHPYLRHKWEILPEPPDSFISRASSIPVHAPGDAPDQLIPSPAFTKDSTPNTDSGTEADDEIFVKRLPAPRARLHKGLRGIPEPPSGVATPLLTPSLPDGDVGTSRSKERSTEDEKRHRTETARRRKEIFRRATEVLILSGLGRLVVTNPDVRPVVASHRERLLLQGAIYAALLALYPLRAALWAYTRGEPPRKRLPLSVPSSFDPATLLYPPVLPILVSLLTASNVRNAILPNLVLGIASLPRALIPTTIAAEAFNPMHWLLASLPLLASESNSQGSSQNDLQLPLYPREALILLYPLHQTLCLILHHLTTTSLLPAELQLLSISLVDLLILSASPQAVILQAILWVGGLGVIVLCGPVIRWGIALARVPKWRFRREMPHSKQPSIFTLISSVFSRKRLRLESGSDNEDSGGVSGCTSDEDDIKKASVTRRTSILPNDSGLSEFPGLKKADTISMAAGKGAKGNLSFDQDKGTDAFQSPSRRHTIPFVDKILSRSKTHTPSGRRKRSSSLTVRAFFSLTQSQAMTRKWLYAGWLYAGIVVVILGGVRAYVQYQALDGNEPIGWALGYILGDLPWFRFQVVQANLERWICLPHRADDGNKSCSLGWVQHLRDASIGEANTRLVLAAYWASVIAIGLLVVFRLSPIYEVDTRRKVFHFMMVAMFLPAIYVDPGWCALALAVVLAIFLLLDLLRASQLPPLSKPITNFLHPYTDGRDHCGPVVISHIFLLIGCAIPLWLSLASLARTGAGYRRGWEVPTRDLSMVAGVVCVGLGDAAASLIGRRWGHHKWLWKGGKSLEGSVAFAVAVSAGLLAANIWLKLGGWPITSRPGDHHQDGPNGLDAVLSRLLGWDWSGAIGKTALCASTASLTEAVLTGGNDNVVVPVVLWTCVKSTGL
ncbi:cytidylyltransferase [Diaporthe helianthi]|uniref:dolichol kinase n=1 Tax=Diaporthe helianthi TaxID=158607 RepID=A0A2P5IA73_DIAHE|nr:cytidylyltransferase [Diaporthe helianthi]